MDISTDAEAKEIMAGFAGAEADRLMEVSRSCPPLDLLPHPALHYKRSN